MASQRTHGDLSRRQFMGSSAMTTAGVAAGLSYYFSKDNVPYPHSEPEDEIKVGFIGVGSRGGALLRAMLRVPGSNIVSICDVREEMVTEKAGDVAKNAKLDFENNRQTTGINTTENWRDVIDDPEVEAVVIATPQFLHGPMAIAALEAGKSVYCEKAMAYTIGECKDIYRLATELRASQVFQVGHQRHYSPMYGKVKEMVRTGQIGNVVGARAQWNRNDEIRRPCADPRYERIINWRLFSEYNGGLMSEFASHQIDVINMLVGKHPESVCGMGGQDYPRYKDNRTTTDNVHVIFNYVTDFRRHVQDAAGNWRFVVVEDENGEPVRYPFRFSYMSIMQNELLGPSEMILGDEGSIRVTLRGGDFWKESKVLKRSDKIAQGTNPFGTHQKSILLSGGTVAAPPGGIRPPDKVLDEGEFRGSEAMKKDWSLYVGKIPGGHSPRETLLALDSFLNAIRLAREGKPYKVRANVKIGLWGAVPDAMANKAMAEERTVHWEEFFPESWWEESFENDWPEDDGVLAQAPAADSGDEDRGDEDRGAADTDQEDKKS